MKITRERIEKIKRRLPETVEERRKRLSKVLSKELVEKIIVSEKYPIFQNAVSELKIDPTIVATTLEETTVSLSREGVSIGNLSQEKFKELFKEYKNGKFVKAAIPEILSFVAPFLIPKIPSNPKEIPMSVE